MSPLWRSHGALLVLLGACALTYSPLWDVAFSWDDEALIVDNQVTGSLANIGEFFTRDLWGTTRLSELKSGYYRPLMLLSLALDRALFGLSATAAHVHSLLWHLAAVVALHRLLVRLVPSGPALAGATLFALHPVQSEVLALVAARNDAMAATFVLFALGLLTERFPSPAKLVGAGALALCGLLSKESAVLAIAMLLALDVARFRRPVGWRRYLALGGALGVYLPLRRLADLDAAIAPSHAAFQVVWEHGLELVGVYGQLLVWPWPLTPARHIHYLPPAADTLFGAFVALDLIVLLLIFGRRRWLVLAGLAWALAAWIPTLAATLDKGLLGERYLYLPMAGFALALAAALPATLKRWLLPAVALPCCVALQLRLPDWKDSRTVWEHAHRVAPTAFTAGGLAWYVHRDRELDRALPLFVMALEGDPPYRDVCDMIVSAHLEAKRAERAVEVARWALEKRGCSPGGLITNHFAVALAGTGRWDEAASVATNRPGGLSGPGITVVLADRARQGDLEVLRRAMAAKPTDRGLPGRVAKLLRLGGEPEAAARVLALQDRAPTPR